MRRLHITLIIIIVALLTSQALAADDKSALEGVQKSIATQEAELERLRRDKAGVDAQVTIMREKLNNEKKLVLILDKEIAANEAAIKKLSANEQVALKRMQEYERSAKAGMEFLIENSGGVTARALVANKNFSDRAAMNEIVSLVNSELSAKIVAYAESAKEYQNARVALNAEQARLEANRQSRVATVAGYSASEKEMQAQVALLEKDARAHEAYIKKLLAQEDSLNKAIAENARKAALAAASNFGRLKGSLPRPVAGAVVIPFNQITAKQGSLEVRHHGITIRPTASEVNAVGDGTVVYTDYIAGIGNIVVVQHDSAYYTVYSNLDEFYTKVTDKVKAGDAIGNIAILSGVPVSNLYFEIRHNNDPVNPADWLAKQ